MLLHFYILFPPFEALPFLPLNKRELSYPVTVFQKTSSERHMHYEYTATETSGVDLPKLPFVISEVLNITSRNRKRSCQSGLFRHLSVYSAFKRLHEQSLSDFYQFSCNLHWWAKCQVFCRKGCIRIDKWTKHVSKSRWWNVLHEVCKLSHYQQRAAP
jgi:hypothetical protein